MNEPDEDLILRSETALGHGVMDNVRTVVYVKPSTFNSAKNPEVAREIAELNRQFTEAVEPYILVGPGRWGSSDSALGIPVRWPQIAGARLIVESALPGYHIEPSQGTHFFQNLTSFGVDISRSTLCTTAVSTTWTILIRCLRSTRARH